MARRSSFAALTIVASSALLLSQQFPQQDLRTTTREDVIKFDVNLPPKPLKMAVADVRLASQPGSATPDGLAKIFNQTLWSDLENAGIFSMVSKSFYPRETPGKPEEVKLSTWVQPPTSTERLVFGTLSTTGERMTVEGYLDDVTGQTAQPLILGKRYADEAQPDAARTIAHRFANEIIRYMGGIPGIAESKIYFASTRSGAKEIWSMDYDGANQHQITHYGDLALSPQVSADGTKLTYSAMVDKAWHIFMLSLETGRRLTFQDLGSRVLNSAASFSPDGSQVAFAASRDRDTNIYIADSSGGNPKKITDTRGVNTSPVFNPRNAQQIAFLSSRSGNAQVYVMNLDGSGVRRISGGGGEAVTPSWSPNGRLLAFSWTRGYAPGNYNIFVVDVEGGTLLQLTYGAGANEHPSWSPDGRHIVFESNRIGKKKQIYTMLADGSQVKALTSSGENVTPVWSVK